MLKRVEHLNRVLKAIRNVNRLLVQETDEKNLLKKICASLVETRGYYNAWIVVLDNNDGEITFAESGLKDKFLPMLNRLEKGELTRCAKKALQSDGVIVVEDPVLFCTDCPLSPMYAGRGAMAVRVEYGNGVHGLMSVSIPAALLNDDEEQTLFKEIADDIGFGLNKIKIEEERNTARYALMKSERRFRDLVENSLTCISIIKNHRVVYQNASESGLFGPITNAFIPPDFLSVHPDDQPKVKKFYMKLLSGSEKNRDVDFRFYPHDLPDSNQNFRWVYCRATKIDFENDKAILVNIMDATEAKEVEHLIRIEEKMSSLGRVAAGIAHEIRNPLSGIYIYLNNLKKIYQADAKPEKVYDILSKLQSASNKIESIIKRVMDFSKPGHPKFVLTDLNPYIEEAIKLSSVALRKSSISLDTKLSENLPQLNTDPQMIEEVILNLITNAMEAMKEMENNKRIMVTSGKNERTITITVSDSGPGISPELYYKVFDPFYTTKTNSSGIGLSICHRIISDHGGTLRVGTGPLGGAEFIIELPFSSIERRVS
ncbi:MAG: GHKL domain-containing protein [Proteobacteria bacterium]|nr:GHKL domain-containing protein [Pseudomonadota bacterium]